MDWQDAVIKTLVIKGVQVLLAQIFLSSLASKEYFS